jgi:NAD(P)-dependent dehydrogenase (short-subunit alcohol dehydrogenase family)
MAIEKAKHRISRHKIYSGDRQSKRLNRNEEQGMSKKFAGKIALVTGGSTGMGLATAKRFVQEGMDHVFITGRRKDSLDAAVAEIGKSVTAVQGDVANLSHLDRLYDVVKKHHRPMDIIYANAGLAKLAPFGTVDEEFFDLHFNANVKGLFFTVQKGLPLMRDGGSIVLNASIADIKGFPAMSVYSATKAAVRSFARTWTNDLRDRRIRVNVISPGHIDTPILEDLQQGEALTKMKKEMTNNVPLGRLGEPDEVAKAVSFLASDEASYVSGAELYVDGGVAQI